MDLTLVPTILGFGFLGLAFLMLYLGYRLMKTVAAQPKPAETTVKMCKFFLVTALAFMVTAGPLQWATMYLEYVLNKPSVSLHIALHDRGWQPEFGTVALRRIGGVYKPLSGEAISEKFGDGEEINISLHEVIRVITDLRSKLQAIHEETLRNTDEIRSAIEGGA